MTRDLFDIDRMPWNQVISSLRRQLRILKRTFDTTRATGGSDTNTRSPYLTSVEAAHFLRYRSPSALWKLVRRGLLKPEGRRPGRRVALWSREQLDALVRAGATIQTDKVITPITTVRTTSNNTSAPRQRIGSRKPLGPDPFGLRAALKIGTSHSTGRGP